MSLLLITHFPVFKGFLGIARLFSMKNPSFIAAYRLICLKQRKKKS
ncbi:hypothetical protein AmDm5_2197 [Acetobacter malorum]|nr:hypothetical protein AmDm5_2197 [Acetobacter malorum]